MDVSFLFSFSLILVFKKKKKKHKQKTLYRLIYLIPTIKKNIGGGDVMLTFN